MRIFWDANALLDLVDADRPDHLPAEAVLRWSASQPVVHLCAWHTLSILDYVCGRKFGKAETGAILREILGGFTIPPCGTPEALAALSYQDGDFEDALQIAAAISGRADWILSRDGEGFAKCPVPVVTPARFLAAHGS